MGECDAAPSMPAADAVRNPRSDRWCAGIVNHGNYDDLEACLASLSRQSLPRARSACMTPAFRGRASRHCVSPIRRSTSKSGKIWALRAAPTGFSNEHSTTIHRPTSRSC